MVDSSAENIVCQAQIQNLIVDVHSGQVLLWATHMNYRNHGQRRSTMSPHTDLNRLIEENRLLLHNLTEVVCELRDLFEQSLRFEADAKEFAPERPEKISIH